MDDINISGTNQRIVALPTGAKLVSILDVRTVIGGVTLTAKAFYIDPGQKAKLGTPAAPVAIATHTNIGASTVDEQNIDEASTKRWTGLWRVEYTLSGVGSVTFSHTLVSKD